MNLAEYRREIRSAIARYNQSVEKAGAALAEELAQFDNALFGDVGAAEPSEKRYSDR